MGLQKQPSRGVLRKRCSENIQQIHRRASMAKCHFNKVAYEITLRHGCSPLNLLHIFRTPFPKNSSGRLLLGLSDCSPHSRSAFWEAIIMGIIFWDFLIFFSPQVKRSLIITNKHGVYELLHDLPNNLRGL